MNKILTIMGGSFFILEAVAIIVYLLDVSINMEVLALWTLGGAVNIAFLVVLIAGAFREE